jgi:hypothetical protein
MSRAKPALIGWTAEVGMLRNRKELKRKTITMWLMRDVQGSAAEKPRMFEKVRAVGGFAKENPAEVVEVEKILQAFAAMEIRD